MRRARRTNGSLPQHNAVAYANLAWIMSGFSCHSSFSTHICMLCQVMNSVTHDEIPHLFERAEPRKNAAASPRGVYSLRRCQNLDAHVLDRQPLHLVEQPVTKAFCQRGASGEHNVAVERFPQVHVRSVNSLDHNLVHARVLKADDLGIEQDLRSPETFRPNLLLSANDDVILRHMAPTLSFCPSGRVYSMLLLSDRAAPDHSFSSFAGSNAT